MKIEFNEIEIVLTVQEARILESILHHQEEDDPNGAASSSLRIDIEEVVSFLAALKDGLRRKI